MSTPPTSKHKRVRPGDIAAIALSLGLAFSGLLFGLSGGSGRTVVIDTPTEHYRYPLEERRLTVRGADGPITIHITTDGARIESSSCPEQLCVRKGNIRRSGDSVICAPNRVRVRIESDKEDFDAITE